MSKFDSKEFVSKFSAKVPQVPTCPYCGGNKFTTTEQFATILIGDDLKDLKLGPHIPAGMIVCANCGHIEFFALGALGMLPKEENHDGEQ